MKSITMNDGITIPTLGLGVYLVRDVAECERSVLTALEAGYRLIDTAAVYGNERAVGRAVAASSVPRSELFITTKIWVTQFGYERTRAAISEALERLGTEYIDLLLLHQPVGDYLGSWKALEEAVAAGTVKSIGLSNFTVDDLAKVLAVATIVPAVNQVERHPYSQQLALSAFHAKHSIVGEAWFPIGHGSKELLAEPIFATLAAKYGKSVVQTILRWHMQTGWVAIPKSTDAAHIRQNLDIFDFELDAAELASIAAIDRARPMFRLPRWALAIGTRLTRVRLLP